MTPNGSGVELEFNLNNPRDLKLKDIPRSNSTFFFSLLQKYIDAHSIYQKRCLDKARLFKRCTNRYFGSLRDDDEDEYLFERDSKQMDLILSLDQEIRKEINNLQRESNLLPLCPEYIKPFDENVVVIAIDHRYYHNDFPLLGVENEQYLSSIAKETDGGGSDEDGPLVYRHQIRKPTDIEYLIAAIMDVRKSASW